MFGGLKSRWFVSQVAAELKGQLGRQDLINEFLVLPESVMAMERVRTERDYLFAGGQSLLPYLGACEVLAAVMDSRSSSEQSRLMASGFLFTRLSRADSLVSPVLDALRQRRQDFEDAGPDGRR